MYWNDKPYHSLDYHLKKTFGEKIYKLALDGGMTCPNRDNTLGTGGCIFCSRGGSGDFAAPLQASVHDQIDAAMESVAGKISSGRYIAYFQSYTNTYAPAEYLEKIFKEALSHPAVAALSVDTRPDCLPPEVIGLLEDLNRVKPVWVELGLQTIHEDTARMIRRGYPLPVFADSVLRLKKAGLTVIAHVILGLPGETRDMMLETVRYLGGMDASGQSGSGLDASGRGGSGLDASGRGGSGLDASGRGGGGLDASGRGGGGMDASGPDGAPLGASGQSGSSPGPGIDGIKLQLLHILKGTDLADYYAAHPFPVFTLEEYLDLVIDCIASLPPRMVIHRISGDGPKSLLIAPLWSANKRLVLNSMTRRFKERGICQGDFLSSHS